MFNSGKLDKLIELVQIQNRLLAKIAGVDEESLKSLELKSANFSDMELIIPPSEKELLEDENAEIETKIASRMGAKRVDDSRQFFEEDEISDILEEINES